MANTRLRSGSKARSNSKSRAKDDGDDDDDGDDGEDEGFFNSLEKTENEEEKPVIENVEQPNYVPQLPGQKVIIPTALPPLAPTLNPRDDMQPLDTRLGDYIKKQFVEAPTVTPPPTQQ